MSSERWRENSKKMASTDISTPIPPVRYGLLDVTVALQLQTCPGGATAVARSGLNPDGSRGIRVWLNPEHLIVSRALHRSDSLIVRFLIGTALVEYCDFWRSSADGRAVYRALKRNSEGTPSREKTSCKAADMRTQVSRLPLSCRPTRLAKRHSSA